MARTLLDYCISEQTKPPVKDGAQSGSARSTRNSEVATVKVRKKRPSTFPPTAPKNLPASYFVSASYDGRQKKVVIKLYEPDSGELYFWYDNTGHKPYCLTNLSVPDDEKNRPRNSP